MSMHAPRDTGPGIVNNGFHNWLTVYVSLYPRADLGLDY